MSQVDAYVGQIMLTAGGWAPPGWLPCDGRSVPIQSYQALFGVLAFTYGGDQRAYFNVPDFRGFFPTMPMTGQSMGAKGGVAGLPQIQITTDNLPAHTHAATFAGSPVSSTASLAVQAKLVQGAAVPQAGSFLSEGGSGQNSAPIFAPPGSTAASVNLSGGQATVSMTAAGTVAVGLEGGSKPLTVPVPYQCLIFCINYDGVYPDRP